MKTIQDLLTRINEDETFREEVRAIGDKDMPPEEGVVAFKKLGYEITAEDWNNYTKDPEWAVKEVHHGELSEEDLENVSGGVGADSKCWFRYTNAWPRSDIQPDISIRLDCGAACFGFFTQCACHGTHRCENKHHIMTRVDIQLLNGAQHCTFSPSPLDRLEHANIRAEVRTFAKL